VPFRIDPLRISAYTTVSAAGTGRAALLQSIRARRSGLRPNDFTAEPLATWVGRVPGLEDAALPAAHAEWECRNNRLAWQGLQTDAFHSKVRAVAERHGETRVAVLMGTSTSSIGATEEAYRELTPSGEFPPRLRRPVIHSPHSLGGFVQRALGLRGVCVTLATACSSSAKVFAQAHRLLRLGLADAAVVGGVDTLCGSVLYGFNALGLVSPEPCRPFDPGRRGISIGEAAGFALLERGEGPGHRLLGYGESSDAYHMSSPRPDGLAARAAIQQALEQGGIDAADVGYLNLHGTASQKNDEIEARVVADMFPPETRASSTKGWTGHTLGAAGITEAAIALLALESGVMPGTLNSQSLDSCCGPQLRLDNEDGELSFAASLSFGFGGSNCVLLFGRGAA
jgi:3-oxoacyl-[acyl-carrier-protein] synthase-1